jgi:hypothetical protein
MFKREWKDLFFTIRKARICRAVHRCPAVRLVNA